MKKKIIISFILAMLLSVALPVGVVVTIAFASKPLLLSLGIVLIAVGFYGCPFAWMHFANLKTKQNLCTLVIDENIQDVEELARLKNVDMEEMLKQLKELINGRYLQGYIIVEDKYIVKNNSKTLTQQELVHKNKKLDVLTCTGCGAPVETFEGEKSVCPYCGRAIKK